MGKNARQRQERNAIAQSKPTENTPVVLERANEQEPLVELGGFVKSSDVIPLIPPLPEGVVDEGWVCAFTVKIGLGKFGGLAFPSLSSSPQKDVCVGLVVLTRENIAAQSVSFWFKKLEDRLRSHVAVRFANLYPTLNTVLTLPTKR